MTKPTPPFLPGLPLIGHALEFRSDRAALLERGYRELGPVYALRLGTRPAAVLVGPEYQQVFFEETDKKLSMHKTYRFLGAMFGEIAFTAPPETYYKQRPILHAPFKRAKMPAYLEIMQEEVQAWLDSLGAEGEFELIAELNTLIQHVAAHALMGARFRQRMGREFWELYEDLSRALDPLLPPNLPLPKFIRRDRAKAEMRQMLRPVIAERRRNPERYDDFLQDFVDARYKDGSKVEDETILGLILGLMFAGHETTVGQSAWSIIQLVQNPGYLECVLTEIARHVPFGTAIDGDVLKSLQHIEWAVRETERMHPSADILLRMVEEDLDAGDYRLPKGWIVLVSAGLSHYLPGWFENPGRYDPLRYAPGREEHKQHRFALIGFGGGMHKCAGMNFAYNEMMMIITLLIQQFDLQLVTEDPQTEYSTGASRPEETILRYRRKAL